MIIRLLAHPCTFASGLDVSVRCWSGQWYGICGVEGDISTWNNLRRVLEALGRSDCDVLPQEGRELRRQ